MSQRPQLSHNDYHDLVSFQAFQIMQLQLEIGARDQEIQSLVAQLAEAKKAAPAAVEAAPPSANE